MAAPTTSVMAELRNEFERVLSSVQPPEYRSAMQRVYRYQVLPEIVSGYPAAWYEIAENRIVPVKSAAQRLERNVTVRLCLYTREEHQQNASAALDALTQDVERALAAELAAAQQAIKDRCGADLIFWHSPDWIQLDTTWFAPFGVAVGLVKAQVRYDYGNP